MRRAATTIVRPVATTAIAAHRRQPHAPSDSVRFRLDRAAVHSPIARRPELRAPRQCGAEIPDTDPTLIVMTMESVANDRAAFGIPECIE